MEAYKYPMHAFTSDAAHVTRMALRAMDVPTEHFTIQQALESHGFSKEEERDPDRLDTPFLTSGADSGARSIRALLGQKDDAMSKSTDGLSAAADQCLDLYNPDVDADKQKRLQDATKDMPQQLVVDANYNRPKEKLRTKFEV